MRTYRLFYGGEFRDSLTGETFDSNSPHDGSVVSRAARSNAADIDLAVRAARKAFDEGPWPRMGRDERAALMKKVVDAINARQQELVDLEVLDSGSTVRKAKEDIYLSARNLNYFSKLAATAFESNIEGLSKPGFSKNILAWEPVGVVGAIIPWNFPLKMAIWKVGPALAAGNTVVLKPSELTPSSAMEFAAMFAEAGFPPGVVNIITGFGADAGEALVRHPMVDKISFTGSTAVGKRVMSIAAETLKKVTLECGGKSANIILDDADFDLAVDGSLYAIYYHQGQCCEAGSRLLLPRSRSREVVERLIEKTKRMRVGDPRDTSTDIGPVISKKQQERILDYVRSGIAEGATLATGGGVPKDPACAKGTYVEPTIFTNVTNGMTIAREEIFGPVLSIIEYASDEEAIAIANDSVYGLGGGVWSSNPGRADAVARRLRAGTVWINEWHLISERAPFGGYKQSGVGREFGVDGMREYAELKHIHTDEVGSRAKKFWYDVVVPPSNPKT